MKKLVATLSLAALTTGAFAQGLVAIQNTAATVFRTNTVAIGGAAGTAQAGTANSYGGFYYEVLTAASTVTSVDASLQNLLTSVWSDTGVSGTNTAGGGRMLGLNPAIATNWPAATIQSFIVVGWSANEGTTWSAVAGRLAGASLVNGVWSGGGLTSGFLGATVVGTTPSGGPAPAGANLLFGAGAGQITGTTDLYFVAVPEPGTLALAGFGAAALMIFRRRK